MRLASDGFISAHLTWIQLMMYRKSYASAIASTTNWLLGGRLRGFHYKNTPSEYK